MKIIPTPALLIAFCCLSFGSFASAATFTGNRFALLNLSQSGYLNNQTVTASINSAPFYAPFNTSIPYDSFTVSKVSIIGQAFDDAADGNGACKQGATIQPFSCPDAPATGAVPYEDRYTIWGDSDQEYLQLGSDPKVAVDDPDFFYPSNEYNAARSLPGILLGELPLSVLAGDLFTTTITVAGDLYLQSARIFVEYDFTRADSSDAVSQVPLPASIWLVGSTLLGFLSLKRKASVPHF